MSIQAEGSGLVSGFTLLFVSSLIRKKEEQITCVSNLSACVCCECLHKIQIDP